MNTLISAAELKTRDAVIFDCRSTLTDPGQGRRDFEAGHIPGARFADLDRDLSSEPGVRGRHPLPDRSSLATFLGENGASNNSFIVAYDQNSGAFAARLWWLLRWLGHADVAVLDGGLDAWIAAGGDTEKSEGIVQRGNFIIRDPLNRHCEASDLLDGGRDIIDARDPARFRGEVEPIDKVAGHIPGARCLPFTENLENGHFRRSEELASRFAGLDENTICYCGSGVTATHNILAMCIAGLPEPVLYPGSWSEWIEDPSRPVATGEP